MDGSKGKRTLPAPGEGKERLGRGRRAEEEAAEFLRAAGYQVLDRNYRCPLGEVDLVARQGREVVFVEVKARRGGAFGAPEEAVTGQKRERLRRVALFYLQARRLEEAPVRFDVLAVDLDQNGRVAGIRHLPGAF